MGKVTHFEIPATDLEQTKIFYETLFDWQIDKVANMDHYFLNTTEMDSNNISAEPGAIKWNVV
jgi:uncharacterized protein